MDAAAVAQLRYIKRWIAVGVIVTLISLIAVIALSIWSVLLYDEMEQQYYASANEEESSWHDMAEEAVERADYEEAVSLADEHLYDFPNDADAFFIKARVAFYQGDKEAALLYVSHLKALAPGWHKEYIYPLEEAIRQDAYNASLARQSNTE